jgi:aminomethyltransferase
MSDTILKTPLFDIHKKLNANIVNYSGYYLPVFYSSIQEEHNAVRNSAGIFDVTHMGNILLKFNSREIAVNFLNYIFPNDFSNIKPFKSIYSTMLNHDGGIIDDLIVMSLSETEYHIIVNAGNCRTGPSSCGRHCRPTGRGPTQSPARRPGQAP